MRPLRIGILGISVDLGLLSQTRCHPKHSAALWLFLIRLIPSIMLWALGTFFLKAAVFWPAKERRQKQRLMSHKLFSFLLSKDNFYEHDDGYLRRLEHLFQRPTEVTNLSRIGHSVRLACKQKHLIPSGQDIFFLDIGAMDYVNNTSCAEFRSLFREILEAVGQKNPEAHVVSFSPPDMSIMLGTPLNKKKALPLPFAPTVGDLQRLEGFHKHLRLTADSAPEKKAYAARLLRTYLKIMQHELRRARRLGVIRSFTFIDGLALPWYRPEDRSLYFGLDGLHLTPDAVLVAVRESWPTLVHDLETMSPLFAGEKDRAAARLMNETRRVPQVTMETM